MLVDYANQLRPHFKQPLEVVEVHMVRAMVLVVGVIQDTVVVDMVVQTLVLMALEEVEVLLLSQQI